MKIGKLFKGKKQIYIYLAIIILLAFLLRIYNLDKQSVWFDESVSLHTAYQSVTYIFGFDDPTPPFFYLIFSFWAKIMPFNDIFARLFSVTVGVISVYLLFKVTSEIFNERVGLISSFLLAVSPLHIYYSQEIRSYSLFLMLLLLSVYFFQSLLKNFNRKNMVLFIIVSTAMLYTQLFGYIVIALEFLFLLIHLKKASLIGLFRWIKVFVVIQILYIPWIIKVILSNMSGDTAWIPFPKFIVVIGYFYNLTSGIIFSYIGLVLFFIFLILFLFYLIKEKNNTRKLILLLCLLFPVVLLFLISLIKPIFLTRYLLMTVFSLCIIIALSIDLMSPKARAITIILILFMSLAVIFIQSNSIIRHPWKQITEDLATNTQKKIGVIVGFEVFPYTYYTNHGCFLQNNHMNVYQCMRDNSVIALKTDKDVLMLSDDKDFYLIESNVLMYEKEKRLLDTINSEFETVSEKAYLYLVIDKRYSGLSIIVPSNITVRHIRGINGTEYN